MTEVNAEAQTTTTTPAEAEQIAFRFINGYFQNAGRDHPRISIPADPLHDDDILLLAFIRSSSSALAQLRQVREDTARLDWLVENRAHVTKHADGMFDVWLPSKSYETARGWTARAAIDAARSALTTTAPKEKP